jgi:uncharacterized protein
MAPAPAVPIGPIAAPERIEAIDVLRGAALFGILASNMRAFNSPLAAYFNHSLMWQDAPDRAAQIAIDILISGKFITIFSFLFGTGFAVMMDRAEARGLAHRSFYLRRLTVLLALGLVHAVFFWYGDILAPYALMGFALILFRRASTRKILMWAGILYLWPLITGGAATLAMLAGAPMPPPATPAPAQLAESIRIYSSGTFAQIFVERMKENTFMLFGLIFFYPRFLGVFLLGLLVWRRGIVRDLDGNQPLLRHCRNWGLAGGLSLSILAVTLTEIYHPNPLGYSPLMLAINAISGFGTPLLSLFYMATLALLLQKPGWHARLRPFAAVGRTALSNYLLHTLICTTLYYSWGFGLYGKVGPLAGLLPTFAIYALLVWLSNWWIARHAFGPLEWVWRYLTYLRRP